jgi:hypothetical protein
MFPIPMKDLAKMVPVLGPLLENIFGETIETIISWVLDALNKIDIFGVIPGG